MTRADYVLTHSPAIFTGLLQTKNQEPISILIDMALATAGNIWDLAEPTRQNRSVIDEIGYKSGYRAALDDSIAILEKISLLDKPFSSEAAMAIQQIEKLKK